MSSDGPYGRQGFNANASGYGGASYSQGGGASYSQGGGGGAGGYMAPAYGQQQGGYSYGGDAPSYGYGAGAPMDNFQVGRMSCVSMLKSLFRRFPLVDGIVMGALHGS